MLFSFSRISKCLIADSWCSFFRKTFFFSFLFFSEFWLSCFVSRTLLVSSWGRNTWGREEAAAQKSVRVYSIWVRGHRCVCPTIAGRGRWRGGVRLWSRKVDEMRGQRGEARKTRHRSTDLPSECSPPVGQVEKKGRAAEETGGNIWNSRNSVRTPFY